MKRFLRNFWNWITRKPRQYRVAGWVRCDHGTPTVQVGFEKIEVWRGIKSKELQAIKSDVFESQADEEICLGIEDSEDCPWVKNGRLPPIKEPPNAKKNAD